jgi:hypothetical protein
MKALLSTLAVILASYVWAGEKPVSAPPAMTAVKGEVLEVNDVESYTYLRLKTKDGETWAAVGRSPVKKGARVTIENVMVMNNFESKSLKRTFQTIVFGTLAGMGASAAGDGSAMALAHSGNAKTSDAGDLPIPKATGANAWTVADIIMKSAELKDKPVQVRGKVVKFNSGIMGKNWVHLRDGSGLAAEKTNDVLVTTASETKVGDIVTAKGIVRTDKDFGSGYAYKVLIEEATLHE